MTWSRRRHKSLIFSETLVPIRRPAPFEHSANERTWSASVFMTCGTRSPSAFLRRESTSER
jgi:hypothetical protein